MSRDSTPEDGEILEDGEIAPDPTSDREPGELPDHSKPSTTRSEPYARQSLPHSKIKAPDRQTAHHDSSRHSVQHTSHRSSGYGSSEKHRKRDLHKGQPADRPVSRPGSRGWSPLTTVPAPDPSRPSQNPHLQTLASEVRELAKLLGMNEAKRETKRFCYNLKDALRRLVQLSDLGQKVRGSEVADFEKDFADLRAKVFAGLRVLQIVSGTGAGRSALIGRPQATDSVQLAAQHMKIFPAPLQREFDGWCKGNKVFGALLQDPASRDAAGHKGDIQKGTCIAASGNAQEVHKVYSKEERPQNPPFQRGTASSSIPGLWNSVEGERPANGMLHAVQPPVPRSTALVSQQQRRIEKGPVIGLEGEDSDLLPSFLKSPAKQASRERSHDQMLRLGISNSERNAQAAEVQAAQHRLPGKLEPKAQASLRSSGALGSAVGVPGLDLDSPAAPGRSSELPDNAPRKRQRTLEVEVSLEDELELYLGNPEPLAPSDTVHGEVKALLEEEPLGPLPPGIDVDPLEDGPRPEASTLGKKVSTSNALEPDVDLDAEAARVFGGDGTADDMDLEDPHPQHQQSVIENGSEQPVSSLSNGNDQLASFAAVRQHLREGKLCLVLDLDHTLLNSARWGEVGTEHASILEEHLEREEGLPYDQRALHSIPNLQMWTKLRPACRAFLGALADRYVMWIHTNGNRHYAAAICSLLDPTGKLFGTRVVANANATEGATAVDLIKKLDAQGLAGLEPITVIVDDTANVWPGHGANLVQVERYCYFPSSTRQFGYKRTSLLEDSRDESPDQGMLSVVQQILLDVHTTTIQRFKAGPSKEQPASSQWPFWDVRAVLSHLRSQVLKGTKLLFSRLWRNDMKSEEHHLWTLAERLGAQCTTVLDACVTHVVTNTRYTEKVQWALQQGKHVVSVRWLEGSSIMWKRANESSFPVTR